MQAKARQLRGVLRPCHEWLCRVSTRDGTITISSRLYSSSQVQAQTRTICFFPRSLNNCHQSLDDDACSCKDMVKHLLLLTSRSCRCSNLSRGTRTMFKSNKTCHHLNVGTCNALQSDLCRKMPSIAKNRLAPRNRHTNLKASPSHLNFIFLHSTAALATIPLPSFFLTLDGGTF